MGGTGARLTQTPGPPGVSILRQPGGGGGKAAWVQGALPAARGRAAGGRGAGQALARVTAAGPRREGVRGSGGSAAREPRRAGSRAGRVGNAGRAARSGEDRTAGPRGAAAPFPAAWRSAEETLGQPGSPCTAPRAPVPSATSSCFTSHPGGSGAQGGRAMSGAG